MSKIAVVTDSTTYLPPELVKQYNITIAPQVLIWGDQTYRDGVDITSEQFFTRLKTTKVMPTTSQVAVLSFQEIFQDLVNKDFEVLALLVSSKLSGTNQSAAQAKELMGPAGELYVHNEIEDKPYVESHRQTFEKTTDKRGNPLGPEGPGGPPKRPPRR